MKITLTKEKKLYKELKVRLQQIPHFEDRRKLRGIIQRIGTVIKHNAIEKEREKWIKDTESIIRVLKGANLVKFAQTIEERLQSLNTKNND